MQKDLESTRQGETGKGVRYVLGISFAAAFVILMALALGFGVLT